MSRSFRLDAIANRLAPIAAVSILALIVFGLSYCSERPKYRFEKDADSFRRPGTRLIDSRGSVDLASPVSWIWPPTTSWTYATPDPIMLDRFFILTFIYGEEPIAWVVDVECKEHMVEAYGLHGDDSAPVARNHWGEPLKTPDGRTYRLYDLKEMPLTRNQWRELCETDWTAEKDDIAESLKRSASKPQ